jgi:hypothetical protein
MLLAITKPEIHMTTIDFTKTPDLSLEYLKSLPKLDPEDFQDDFYLDE